jgi:hypothetical protein
VRAAKYASSPVKVSWNASAVTAVEQTAYSSVNPMTFSSSAARFFSVLTCFCSDVICAWSDFSVGVLVEPASAGVATSSTTAAAAAIVSTCLIGASR